MKRHFFLCSFILFLAGIFVACEMDSNKKNDLSDKDSPTSIYISQKPEKLKYLYGEALNLSGIVVTAKYTDDTEKTIENWSSSPADGAVLTSPGNISVYIIYQGKTESFEIKVANIDDVPSTKYFWGTWVKMSDGMEYEVREYDVVETNLSSGNSKPKNYKITDCTEDSLTVNNLGTFTKDSDRVMLNNNIPYFRKGGVDIEYSLKIVGFENTARAVSTFDQNKNKMAIPMKGIKGKATSIEYDIEMESESDEDGVMRFIAPTIAATQVVSAYNGTEFITLPAMSIPNNDAKMGTVAIVGEDVYNLKATATISPDPEDNGYLYKNKPYNMKLSITNISKSNSPPSKCEIVENNKNFPNLKVNNLSIGIDLAGVLIPTLTGGGTIPQPIELTIEYGDLSEPYIDTELDIIFTNPTTEQNWTDSISLRFFNGKIPITIYAETPTIAGNKDATLNGFIIYPDDNNQFFSVKNKTPKTVYIPTFENDKKYLLVFSGATTPSSLSKSTEMHYTINIGTETEKTIIQGGADIDSILQFGGNNHTETNAYPVTESFQAYLADGEIDYYSIPVSVLTSQGN